MSWVRFGLRFDFDEDLLDPMESPRLLQELDQLKQNFINWANDPEGLERDFKEMAAMLREEFCEKNPKLRIRYAKAIASREAEKKLALEN